MSTDERGPATDATPIPAHEADASEVDATAGGPHGVGARDRDRASDQAIARQAWDRLAQVYDPEIGIDVVNLGLIYELTVEDGAVGIRMTLTTPGCPMSDSLPDAVGRAIALIPGVDPGRIRVETVWEPAWEPDRMSDFAKLQLGWS